MWADLIPRMETEKMRVELDKKALFALASDTRIEILRALQPMRRTVTQLAETLDIDKAAVHRHLQKLADGGFVKRYDDHGFVYYGLSWKARDLMAPNENTKVVVLLGAFFWTLMGAIAAATVALGSSVLSYYYVRSGETPPTTTDGPLGGWGRFQEVVTASPPSPLWSIVAIGLPILAVGILLLAWRLFRRPRQSGAVPEPMRAPA